MARNEEKHYGRLNRLYLLKEKEEHEKANPKRPKLNTLETPEEIQKWLPSIKKDIDFYLKKTQVTCYTDAHVEESKEMVVKLENEFKAFVRKIKRLSPSPLEVIPWTSRPYKKQKLDSTEEPPVKEFVYIPTPILDNEIKNSTESSTYTDSTFESPLMDLPLEFSPIQTAKSNFQDQDFRDLKVNVTPNSLPFSLLKSKTMDCTVFSEDSRNSESSDQASNRSENARVSPNKVLLSIYNNSTFHKKLFHQNETENRGNSSTSQGNNEQEDINFLTQNKINLVNYDSSESDS